ncbi:hypothetical protein SDC9_48098 [bioreactor metagenome]|uniref:Uncharacterized protein n=1 Tax=bioreactor metagenome TaxID=1076179 RepID=A0A644WED7_9ZZZZ
MIGLRAAQSMGQNFVSHNGHPVLGGDLVVFFHRYHGIGRGIGDVLLDRLPVAFLSVERRTPDLVSIDVHGDCIERNAVLAAISAISDLGFDRGGILLLPGVGEIKINFLIRRHFAERTLKLGLQGEVSACRYGV